VSVTPNDFLVIATTPSSASLEMALRNSVSRAYYSGYLHAKGKTLQANVTLPTVNGGVHQRLIKAFELNVCGSVCGGLSSNRQSEIAGLLSLSKQLRTKADYKLSETVHESDKETALANAIAIMERLP
jgi:uncharacterized protein (UPF0332 family)